MFKKFTQFTNDYDTNPLPVYVNKDKILMFYPIEKIIYPPPVNGLQTPKKVMTTFLMTGTETENDYGGIYVVESLDEVRLALGVF